MSMRWGDGPGTLTPPGHWNALAMEAIKPLNLDEPERASILAVLNMALMDAGIHCWKCKYKHWLQRPSQADPRIMPLMRNPSFPSYVSGHATFSSAAAEVLATILPGRAKEFRDLAHDATRSRLIAGIHFPFDCDEGAILGVKIGKRAVQYARTLGLSHFDKGLADGKEEL